MTNSNSFKKLQREWDKRLKDSGFVDVEKTVGNTRQLITSSNPYRDYRESNKEAKESYYQQLTSHWVEATWDNLIDYYVIGNVVQGRSIVSIVKSLLVMGLSRDRKTIRYIIRRYETKWGIKKWKKPFTK